MQQRAYGVSLSLKTSIIARAYRVYKPLIIVINLAHQILYYKTLALQHILSMCCKCILHLSIYSELRGGWSQILIGCVCHRQQYTRPRNPDQPTESAKIIPYPRERGPMGGAPYIGMGRYSRYQYHI